jgi:hypothetical protein
LDCVSRLRLVSASALTLGLAVCATQCSLTTSLEGLSGGASPEAGSIGETGGSDAPVGDGATPDSSTDAGSDGGRYCASLTTQPSFCDDFDDEGPFSKWTTSVVGAGGSAVRDRSAAVSAPNSLLTTSAVSASSVPALLRLASPTLVHRVRVAYDLRVEARDPQTAYAEVGYIRFGPGETHVHAFYMRLFADPTLSTSFTAEAYLPDAGISQANFNPASNPQFTKWTRVAVDYDLRGAPRVEVSIDGVSAGQTALDASIFTPDFASVEVGIGYAGHPTSAAWQLRYDNVTVDWD